jgi:hypothetical protein
VSINNIPINSKLTLPRFVLVRGVILIISVRGSHLGHLYGVRNTADVTVPSQLSEVLAVTRIRPEGTRHKPHFDGRIIRVIHSYAITPNPGWG